MVVEGMVVEGEIDNKKKKLPHKGSFFNVVYSGVVLTDSKCINNK